MKKLFILLFIVCAFVLVSCDENEISQSEINNTNIEKQLSADDINENIAQQFLNGEITVDNFNDKNNVTVSEIGYFGTPLKYALVDLDSNEARELVIEYHPSGDRAIIRKNNKEYTAYYLPIRACNDLKKDGTMGWSASAFEHGIQKMRFSDGNIEFEQIIVYNAIESIFMIDGKNVSQDECNSALARQDEKESVEWIEIQ